MSSCSCVQPLPHLFYNPQDHVGCPWPTVDLSTTRRRSCDQAAPWTEPKGLRGQAVPLFILTCSVWWAALSSIWTLERAMAAGSIRSNMLSFLETNFLSHGFIRHVCIWGRGIVPWCTCGCHRAPCRSWFLPSTLSIWGIELRSSGLAASTFTCCAISPAPCCPSLPISSRGLSVTSIGLRPLPHWRSEGNQIHLQKCGLQRRQILHHGPKELAAAEFPGEWPRTATGEKSEPAQAAELGGYRATPGTGNTQVGCRSLQSHMPGQRTDV